MHPPSTEPPFSRPRTDDVKVNVNVTRLGVIIGALAAVVALAGAWFILPYRMDAAEKKISAVEEKSAHHDVDIATIKEILVRIDENVKEMRRERRQTDRPLSQ